MAVVMANFGGPSGGLPSGGASTIWSPEGEALVTLAEEGPGVALAVQIDGRWEARSVAVPGA
jgi:hypothetical protein